MGKNMQTFETADPTEAGRCRRAQYRNEIKTLTLLGSTVTGRVLSVMEIKSSNPQRWTVKVAIAKQALAA
jgi:hypothetical protein